MRNTTLQKIFTVKPGMVYYPAEPVIIQSVAAFGIVVTAWDKFRRLGGACHFIYPRRVPGKTSNSCFAAPAIVSLLETFRKNGSELHHLEVHVTGGAFPANTNDLYRNHCNDNAQTALELLDKYGINPQSTDVGGNRGRRIFLNTYTGELAVMKTSSIRRTDWILSPSGPVERL